MVVAPDVPVQLLEGQRVTERREQADEQVVLQRCEGHGLLAPAGHPRVGVDEPPAYDGGRLELRVGVSVERGLLRDGLAQHRDGVRDASRPGPNAPQPGRGIAGFDLGIPGFFGLQNLAVKALPDGIDGTPVDPEEFIAMDSQSRNTGRGSVNRAEEIRMNLAAVISPLRVRGGTAILNRLQRQVRGQIDH